MFRYSHWTPQYLWDRLAVMMDEWRHPEAPWLTRPMVDLLDSWLRPTDRGLEWGSGCSTVWLARRVQALVSVEHDPSWYRRVQQGLQQQPPRSPVDHRLIRDEAGYVAVAHTLPPASLDFCLVDGLARDRCAVAALPLITPGGVLILDNSNWYLPTASRAPTSRRAHEGPASAVWKQFLQQVQGWRCLWTSNGVTDTTLWIKPCGGGSG